MPTVTEIIKALRAAGLSQTEISRRTLIPQSRLSRWEGGEVPAGAEDALKLARLHADLAPDALLVPTEETRDAA